LKEEFYLNTGLTRAASGKIVRKVYMQVACIYETNMEERALIPEMKNEFGLWASSILGTVMALIAILMINKYSEKFEVEEKPCL